MICRDLLISCFICWAGGQSGENKSGAGVNLERGRIWGEGKCAWDYLFRVSHLYSPSVSSSVLNAAPASGLVRGIITTKKEQIICAICCLRGV